MQKVLAALGAIPVLAAASTAIDPKPYVRDVPHSQINFIAESQLVDAHGTFDRWDAEILFDAEKVEASSVKLTIDAKSINTRIEMRDNHLKSNDFFAADSFPTITFASKFVNKLSEDRVNITGDLTIRGRTKTITVPSRLVFFDPARKVGRIKGEFTIDRNDFGVSFQPPVNRIQPEVRVQFDIAFTEKK